MKQNTNIEKDLFADALELPPDQREGFLKGACQSDEQLRQRIEDLLRVHGDASRILAAEDKLPRRLDAPITEDAGTVIGRYKLLEKIGEGGFGAVYVAEQRDSSRRCLHGQSFLSDRRRGVPGRPHDAPMRGGKYLIAFKQDQTVARVFPHRNELLP